VSRELIERLYTAMDRKDGDTMAACYARDARFSDPAFGELRGSEPGDMWRMLTARANDLSVELAEHEADDQAGTARWIARYTFVRTGRPVVNDVRSTFRFKDGLIAEHYDRFSFWAWSRQALGQPGVVLGWSPLLQGAVRRTARGDLEKFTAGESA
jgi:ketosteroid isomerase-like protein